MHTASGGVDRARRSQRAQRSSKRGPNIQVASSRGLVRRAAWGKTLTSVWPQAKRPTATRPRPGWWEMLMMLGRMGEPPERGGGGRAIRSNAANGWYGQMEDRELREIVDKGTDLSPEERERIRKAGQGRACY
jgi:hypothetical protein